MLGSIGRFRGSWGSGDQRTVSGVAAGLRFIFVIAQSYLRRAKLGTSLPARHRDLDV